MSNTSASGGYLTPSVTPAPLYDDALDDAFQAVIVGLTGLDGSMVRPRYQPRPPKQPASTANWCAVGARVVTPDANPAIIHDGQANGGLGQDNFVRHEEIEVLASFYGPNANALAAQARDGLAVAQNNEVLSTQLMLYINADTIRQVPELVNEVWIRRYDLPLHFRRQVKRTYAVQNIASANSTITTAR